MNGFKSRFANIQDAKLYAFVYFSGEKVQLPSSLVSEAWVLGHMVFGYMISFTEPEVPSSLVLVLSLPLSGFSNI